MKKMVITLCGLVAGIFSLILAGLPAQAAAPDIEMIAVKGGCFLMGDTFGSGSSDEQPVHEACLDDYSIGKFEVTQEQWQTVMGNNPSFFTACGPNCPVENVSWDDAQEFIAKLNALTGKNYRLPYEAEWEYAARSGGQKQQWAGTSDAGQLGAYAWFRDNSDKQVHPVGGKMPNGLGIYDMSGNVWEWCDEQYSVDFYTKSPKKNPRNSDNKPRKNPEEVDKHENGSKKNVRIVVSGGNQVARGGSWAYSADGLRTTDRGGSGPLHRSTDFGFRLVLPVVK